MSELEDDDPTQSIIAMILQMQEQMNQADRRRCDRETALYTMYTESIRNNLEIKKHDEERKGWEKLANTTTQDLFIPGTIIRDGSNLYVVVEAATNGRLSTYAVSNPPSRAKHPQSIYLSETMRIVSADSIEDEKLRNTAKKLVAKIRLKDW